MKGPGKSERAKVRPLGENEDGFRWHGHGIQLHPGRLDLLAGRLGRGLVIFFRTCAAAPGRICFQIFPTNMDKSQN